MKKCHVTTRDRTPEHAPVRNPMECRSVLVAACINLHLVGHHECRVKPDSKLANNVGFRARTRVASVGLNFFQKLFGSRPRYGAQILHQLLIVHADARVSDGERIVGLVGNDADLQWLFGFHNLLVGKLHVA